MPKRLHANSWLTLPGIFCLVFIFSITFNWIASSETLSSAADQVQSTDGAAGHRLAPAPDPPQIDLNIRVEAPAVFRSLKTTPSVEWTYHKTSDGAHPDGNEQQMLWLANRARSNPTAEGIWLADSSDAGIISAINYFSVDLDLLRSEFAAIEAKPPAAFDVRLYNAAKAHCEDLIARDAQDHNQQFDRVTAAGFSFYQAGGIVFSYARSAVYAHGGFNIDWGPGDGTGMQPGRGHRLAIMSVDREYANVGMAVVSENDSSTSVGPLVVTGNYCKANPNAANHYNRFLVGTVWEDDNDNDQYDPGEGIGGVTVMPDQGTYFAVTSDSGGYAIPITDSGQYTVTFSGSALSGSVVKIATVGSDSVLLDYILEAALAGPTVSTGTATSVDHDSATLNGTVYPNADSATWYFQYGTTSAYGSETTEFTAAENDSVFTFLTGLVADTTYHYRIVGVNTGGTSYGSDQTFTTNSSPDRDQVEAFVTRFYQQCLGRSPDATGLTDWVDDLLDGTTTGADVARGFVLSSEFIDQNFGNEAFLDVLYTAFFNRDADAAGRAAWLAELTSGTSRSDVLDGFIYAQEFINLCDDYGITAASENLSATEQVASFVTRFYQQCLDREPDNAGLTIWVRDLLDESITGADLAYSFVFSPEFINQNKSDQEYLTILYRAFFNREPDTSGFNLWLQELQGGMSRLDALNGFTGAQEFTNLCDEFGITPR